MDKDTFLSLDYEAVQAEKRDRMNARLQIWQIVIALVSGFALASLQSGVLSYVVTLYPLLAMAVARYAGHNEMVLDQLKGYLLQTERDTACGYEHWNKINDFRNKTGGHAKALRDALLTTEILATFTVTARLLTDHLFCLIIAGVVVVEVVAVIKTAWYLKG